MYHSYNLLLDMIKYVLIKSFPALHVTIMKYVSEKAVT